MLARSAYPYTVASVTPSADRRLAGHGDRGGVEPGPAVPAPLARVERDRPTASLAARRRPIVSSDHRSAASACPASRASRGACTTRPRHNCVTGPASVPQVRRAALIAHGPDSPAMSRAHGKRQGLYHTPRQSYRASTSYTHAPRRDPQGADQQFTLLSRPSARPRVVPDRVRSTSPTRRCVAGTAGATLRAAFADPPAARVGNVMHYWSHDGPAR